MFFRVTTVLPRLRNASKLAGKKYGITHKRHKRQAMDREVCSTISRFFVCAIEQKNAPARRNAILERRLFHGQVYDFKYHRVKTQLLLGDDPKNAPLSPLQAYLEDVPRNKCPHELFRKQNRRASQNKQKFNLDEVEITPVHENVAVQSARFALQSVTRNKLRHETLQEFMLINDSATVAVELPIVLTAEDLAYYKDTVWVSLFRSH